jgi:hypothetical protein
MNVCTPFPKPGIPALGLSLVFLLFAGRCDAVTRLNEQQQSQPQQQQQNPPPPDSVNSTAPQAKDAADPSTGPLPIKRRKVWSNDDVVGLRTPADNYQVEKEEKQAAEAAAAAKEAATRAAAKSDKQLPLNIKLPDTVEETRKMIKDTEDDIVEGTLILDKMRKELESAPEEQQPDKQRQIDRLSANLEVSRRNLRALQDHLQVLSPKPEAGNPPPPPPSF